MYLPASLELFDYVLETAKASKEFIGEHLSIIEENPEYAGPLSVTFRQVKQYWVSMHEVVRPAVDADTLSVPTSLINWMEDRVQSISHCENTRIVVLVISDLNYLQYQISYFRKLVDNLRIVVPGAPKFPANLALIGIPYSNSQRLLPNLLVLHELGHYVFQKEDLTSTLGDSIRRELERTLAGEPSIDKEPFEWLVQLITRWCEELFCDLFGAALGGPAFSIAEVELFDTLHDLSGDRGKIFTKDHPSDALRFEGSVATHLGTGWWDHFQESEIPSVNAMKALKGAEGASLELDDGPGDTRILEAFFAVQGKVRPHVDELVGELSRCPADFPKWRVDVGDCLAAAIVPSALLDHSQNPTEITMINAGYLFILERLDELLSNLDPSSSDHSLARQAFAMERVEQWLAKGIEDRALVGRSSRR